MDMQRMDATLTLSGVKYLPWVGKDYHNGLYGRRLLVLGESHYDEWDGVRHELADGITRTCVTEAVNREEGSPFWKHIEQALLNEHRVEGWAPSGGAGLWNRLAVYNFVQSAVLGGPRTRPAWEAFESSREPFRAVLEELRPERVLVCGRGLWERMEEVNNDEDAVHDDLQAYRLANGTKVWCFVTVHPCSGRYSWSWLHPRIKAFMDDPQAVTHMLGSRSW